MRTVEGLPLAGRRIALVLATSTGGTGRHVRVLSAGLSAAGAAVVVAGPASTEQAFDFAGGGAHFQPVPIGSAARPLATVAAVHHLRPWAARADLVHAHGLRAGAVAALATPRAVPLVATWHNAVLGGGPTRMLSAPLERLVARRAAVSLCVSPDLEHRVASLGGRDVRPALVSAPERPRTQRSRAAIRADLAAGDRPLVLTVARLHPQKGLHTLIDAADRLAGRSPAPLFAVAGDGPLRAELAARIEATGAPVSLLGHREDVADLLAACDLAVLPSVWEGSPLAAQESLRAGVPLIGTRVGGVAALVGDAGLLVPPDDDVALADAIGAVLDDPALAADLARKVRDAAQRLPSDESVVAEVAAIYAELLEAPRH